jgi:hypothetical protein
MLLKPLQYADVSESFGPAALQGDADFGTFRRLLRPAIDREKEDAQ